MELSCNLKINKVFIQSFRNSVKIKIFFINFFVLLAKNQRNLLCIIEIGEANHSSENTSLGILRISSVICQKLASDMCSSRRFMNRTTTQMWLTSFWNIRLDIMVWKEKKTKKRIQKEYKRIQRNEGKFSDLCSFDLSIYWKITRWHEFRKTINKIKFSLFKGLGRVKSTFAKRFRLYGGRDTEWSIAVILCYLVTFQFMDSNCSKLPNYNLGGYFSRNHIKWVKVPNFTSLTSKMW